METYSDNNITTVQVFYCLSGALFSVSLLQLIYADATNTVE